MAFSASKAWAKASAEPIFDEASHTGTEVSDLVVGSAIAASFARLLAGKLIALHQPEHPLPAEQPEE